MVVSYFYLYDEHTSLGSQPVLKPREQERMSRNPSFRFTSEAGGSTRLSARVAEALLGKIREGELAAGARLPSEEALARHFGVSRTVIRAAMASLRAGGA